MRDDKILLSIINKAIETIDEEQIQTIILDTVSHIERKVTLSMIMDAYGKEIIVTSILVVSILLFNIFSNVRTSNKLREQNKKYEVLSQISNEYIFEYYVKERNLKLSDKFKGLFVTPESYNEMSNILKEIFSNNITDLSDNIIKLPLSDKRIGYFKAINTNILDQGGKTNYIIGKLVDVSEEVVEKEALLVKAQTDGLTGLYNATTTKYMIIDRLDTKKNHDIDALILMDCDGFKSINDTQGHLVGDGVLESVALSLKQTFRNTDIIGRIGGDEFCVYLKSIQSIDSVIGKCKQLDEYISRKFTNLDVSVSKGIALITQKEAYEDVFKKADTALYQAKSKGKSLTIVWEKQERDRRLI
jgi:diguanylate cyclase (GGDEF)-like protein